MIRFELDNKTAYDLLIELVIAIDFMKPYYDNDQCKNLIKSLRLQLSGLIDDKDEWIDYSDDDFLKSELHKLIDRMDVYDHNNPFQRGLPYAYSNLLTLYQQRCKHKRQKYGSLPRSPYQTLYCQDCKSELSGLEFKSSFLERNNIDLSVFEDKKTNE